MRRQFALSFLLVVLAAACANATPSPAPTVTLPAPASLLPSPAPSPSPAAVRFATPEDAVRAYLAMVASADADAVLAMSAVADAAAAFDFVAQSDHVGVMQLVGNLGPAEYPFYANANKAYLSYRLLGQAQAFAYSVLSSAEVVPQPVPADADQIAAFVADVDPSQLAGLEVVDVRPPRASMENDPRARQNALEVAAIFGATDDVQRVALVKLGDEHYQVGFELLQYDDGWKVLLQTSSYAALPPSGVAVPITPEEFDAQTSQ